MATAPVVEESVDGLSTEERNAILDFLESGRPRHPLENEGWIYVDPRVKFSPEIWQTYLAIYGPGEYQILIESAGQHRDGQPWQRGQLLVSPTGQRNMAEYVARIREPGAAQVN